MKKFVLIIVTEILIGFSILYYIDQGQHVYEFNNDKKLIEVTITGAINVPGTYRLKMNSRLSDLISFAQDLRLDADIERIDFNQIIESKVYHIPFYDYEDSEVFIYKINLNDADIDTLKKIPGMTDVRLENFIHYRKTVKIIYSIAELLNVKGIGQKTYESMEKYVTV